LAGVTERCGAQCKKHVTLTTLEKLVGRDVARSRTEFGQKDAEMFVAGYVTLGKFLSSLCRNLCPVVARVPMKAD